MEKKTQLDLIQNKPLNKTVSCTKLIVMILFKLYPFKMNFKKVQCMLYFWKVHIIDLKISMLTNVTY